MHARFFVATLFLCLVLIAPTAHAQSTIFHSPTTDTVAKGDFHLEFDWLAQDPNTQALSRVYIFSPRLITGVARNIEIGVTAPDRRQSTTDHTFFEPNVKWKFASSERKGIAAAVGAFLT